MAPRFPAEGYYVGVYWLGQRANSPMWCRSWCDKSVKPNQTRRKSLGTRDLEQAKILLSRWHTLNVEMCRADPADVLLTDLIVRHVEKHLARKRSADTIRRSLLMWDDHFPGRTVGSLTPGNIEDFGRTLLERYSSETVRRVLSDGRAMLNRARKRGELTAVPFVPVESFERGEPRERILTAEETARLFLATEKPWLQRFIMLAAATGARTEAILELRTFQIDRGRELIKFNPPGRRQTKKRRPTLPVAEHLWPWLEEAEGELVIGRGPKAFGIAWRAAREAAGLGPDVLPTTFRHTLHTLFDERDVPLTQTNAWFDRGSGEAMTDHYTHRRTDREGYLSQARAVVDAWLAAITKAIGLPRQQEADLDRLSVRACNVLAAQPSRGVTPRKLVLLTGIEPATSSLPRTRSTD